MDVVVADERAEGFYSEVFNESGTSIVTILGFPSPLSVDIVHHDYSMEVEVCITYLKHIITYLKICYNNYIHVYTLQVFISKHIYTCTSCKLLSIHVPGHDFIVPVNQAFAGLELTPDLLHSACAN